jgi:hypothetical protein
MDVKGGVRHGYRFNGLDKIYIEKGLKPCYSPVLSAFLLTIPTLFFISCLLPFEKLTPTGHKPVGVKVKAAN